jgi:hypothetical protein
MKLLTIEAIKAAKTYKDIFENDESKVKSEYKAFIKKYHPDVYKEEDLTQLISKLNVFYDEALDKLRDNIWNEKAVVEFKGIDGKTYRLKYLIEHSFELGKFYIGRNHVIYVFDTGKEKYAENAVKTIGHIAYANDSMRDNFQRRMPTIESKFNTIEGKTCLVMKKSPDVYLLEDLLKYFEKSKKELDPRHCAWIINRLCSIACFLKYNEYVLNGISISNMYVSPQFHSIMVIGGWWYCVPNGEKMIGTQKNIYELMPVKEKTSKIATYTTDIESIKLIGRQLNLNVPAPMLNWYNKASSDDAYKEIAEWAKAIDESFGARKFVELDISENDIYNK